MSNCLGLKVCEWSPAERMILNCQILTTSNHTNFRSSYVVAALKTHTWIVFEFMITLPKAYGLRQHVVTTMKYFEVWHRVPSCKRHLVNKTESMPFTGCHFDQLSQIPAWMLRIHTEMYLRFGPCGKRTWSTDLFALVSEYNSRIASFLAKLRYQADVDISKAKNLPCNHFNIAHFMIYLHVPRPRRSRQVRCPPWTARERTPPGTYPTCEPVRS